MKAGDLLDDPGGIDAWCVLDVMSGQVIAIDTACWEVFRWHACSDGIRVALRLVTRDSDRFIVSDWLPVEISWNPPPAEIATYLRKKGAR